MPLDLTKKEKDDPMAQQRRADEIARERRIENEFNEKHGIKTPEDAERFIQKCKDEIFAKTANFGKVALGEKAKRVSGKNKCINCGAAKIIRQYDKTKSSIGNVIWIGYKCLVCGETGMQIGEPKDERT